MNSTFLNPKEDMAAETVETDAINNTQKAIRLGNSGRVRLRFSAEGKIRSNNKVQISIYETETGGTPYYGAFEVEFQLYNDRAQDISRSTIGEKRSELLVDMPFVRCRGAKKLFSYPAEIYAPNIKIMTTNEGGTVCPH